MLALAITFFGDILGKTLSKELAIFTCTLHLELKNLLSFTFAVLSENRQFIPFVFRQQRWLLLIEFNIIILVFTDTVKYFLHSAPKARSTPISSAKRASCNSAIRQLLRHADRQIKNRGRPFGVLYFWLTNENLKRTQKSVNFRFFFAKFYILAEPTCIKTSTRPTLT